MLISGHFSLSHFLAQNPQITIPKCFKRKFCAGIAIRIRPAIVMMGGKSFERRRHPPPTFRKTILRTLMKGQTMQVSYFKMSTQEIISEYGLLTALVTKRNQARTRAQEISPANWRSRSNAELRVADIEVDIMTVLDGGPACLVDTIQLTTADVGECDACPLAATCRTANAS